MRAVRQTEAQSTQTLTASNTKFLTEFAKDDMGVSFYRQPAAVEMSVREFEEITCDRLKLLHAFDRQCGYDTHLMQIPEMKGKLVKDLMETKLVLDRPTPSTVSSYEEEKALFCRRDLTGHFALRLAFCKTVEARQWFSKQEQRLFVLRFDALGAAAQEALLKTAGVRCRKTVFDSSKESQAKLKMLQESTPGAKIWGDNKLDFDKVFYEMPFFEAHPALVAGRKVVIDAGIAYVPSSQMKLILIGKFRSHLEASLDAALQGNQNVLADPRVGGFLRLIQDHGLQLLVAPKNTADDVGEKLSIQNFDELLVRSFPPCMRSAVEHQREQKKRLKHQGKLQLRPFLKECGFIFEESMRWWKTELCRDKEVDAVSFEKNYAYDIEHTYGKKGNFQGQNAFGCAKIIGFPIGAGVQVHGCPFRQMEMPQLKQQLHRWRVPELSMMAIEKFVNNGKHFQLACIEYFKATHPGHEGDGVGNSPGDFFKESCRCHEKKAGGKGSPTKATDNSKLADSPAANASRGA